MSQTASTASVEPSQRLAYWTDMVCSTYVQLECDAAAGASSVEGEIVCDTLSTLQLSTVTASAQRVRRTAAQIARSSEDYLLVSIQSRGEGVVSQGGRTARLGPGDFALYDSTLPYELQFGASFQQYVLRLPGPMLRTALRDAPSLTAAAVCGQRGAGHLLMGMIRTLADEIGDLAPASAHAIAESVTQIVVAGLSTLPQAHRPATSALTAYHRERIKACVRRRLAEPALTVAAIAAELRMSPSTLHRAWSGEPCSIAEWIRSERLDAARRELGGQAARRRSVTEVAYACGFSDPAHFSRAFRARFGCSAREFKARQALD